MSTASAHVFLKVLKSVSATLGIEIRATNARDAVAELEDSLTSEEGDLEAAAIVARPYSTAERCLTVSRAWTVSDFSDRVEAVLALLAVGTVVRVQFSSQTVIRQHWAPVCFTRGFRAPSPQKISRGMPLRHTRFAHDEVGTTRQKELMLPSVGKTGYHSDALEAFFCAIESMFSTVMRSGAPADGTREFSLGLFALIQNQRMHTPSKSPAKGLADFISGVIDSLPEGMRPTIHRSSSPVGFMPEQYFRTYQLPLGTLHLAPVARNIVVVFSDGKTPWNTIKRVVNGLAAQQRAVSIRRDWPVFGDLRVSEPEDDEN